MDNHIIKSISEKIYQRFPYLRGVKPKIRTQSTQPGYLLTYRTDVRTTDNLVLTRIVRVVVNQEGKVLKISTSR